MHCRRPSLVVISCHFFIISFVAISEQSSPSRGLVRDAPPTGAMGLRALAAAAFLVGIKSSSPSESPPTPPPRLLEPMNFRVLRVACFRLTFLPLESTTALSSHSWHAFCHVVRVRGKYPNNTCTHGETTRRALSTHLPFLEEAVEIGVPDLCRSEFEKG
jgi:hypothetical protein